MSWRPRKSHLDPAVSRKLAPTLSGMQYSEYKDAQTQARGATIMTIETPTPTGRDLVTEKKMKTSITCDWQFSLA